jgi:hypothetical protein
MKLYIKVCIVLIFFANQMDIFPQISSSYTRLGLGDNIYTYSARMAGMGGLGASIIDVDYVSILNPASLTGLQSTRTELGVVYNGLFLSNNNASSFSASTDFSGATIVFPISKEHGITFSAGLLPYTKVSYNEENQYIETGTINTTYDVTYEGKGGLSKMFLGTTYRFPFDLSIGARVEYYFGELNYNTTISFPNDNTLLKGNFNARNTPSGFGSTIGIISPDMSKIFNSGSLSDLRLGVAVSFSSNLNADTSLIISSSLLTDTVYSSSIDMLLPYRVAAGASFVLNKKYLFSLDYLFQPWSKYALNGKTLPYLRNSYKVSAGFEYSPVKETGQSFWEQVMFRLGLTYEQTQYYVDGQGINEYSVMGGISLPLSYENTLDFSLAYSIRGTNDFNLFKEKIIRLTGSVSLGELWFLRNVHY